MLNAVFGSLAILSLALLIWQWWVARRFPLHQRVNDRSFAPPVTLLKSLKGCDASTEKCLRSWFTQDYAGEIQMLFGVASATDPVCEVVQKLMREYAGCDAQLKVYATLSGANAKVSKLLELERLAKYEIVVISDADVLVPADLLSNIVAPLRQEGGSRAAGSSVASDPQPADGPAAGPRAPGIGLVNCFYCLANPSTLAMQWEAIAVNADFWSQVLQSQSLKPPDFALGAVMATRRRQLGEIGGFQALRDCLADDYQLGNRIARRGHRIVLSPVVVECWDSPMNWRAVWKHQLRWARTIRVCQPVPYFFSILSNAGWWALLWLAVALAQAASPLHEGNPAGQGTSVSAGMLFSGGVIVAALCCLIRVAVACDLQRRLTRSMTHFRYFWLVPVKDLLQTAIWCCAFMGKRIEWRGRQFTLKADGTMVKG